MKKLLFGFAFIVSCFAGTQAQAPRIIEKKPAEKSPEVLAPASFKAKYDGGMFGYNHKEEGTLRFDDANFKLVFFDSKNRELFSIPYNAIISISPMTHTAQSTGGKVMERVPLPGAGIAGVFMKDKKRYLVVNFDDARRNAKETANFKLESDQLLTTLIQTLGNKAEMEQRGDSYYRPLTAADKTEN